MDTFMYEKVYSMEYEDKKNEDSLGVGHLLSRRFRANILGQPQPLFFLDKKNCIC
jgi:hypothetical protein